MERAGVVESIRDRRLGSILGDNLNSLGLLRTRLTVGLADC